MLFTILQNSYLSKTTTFEWPLKWSPYTGLPALFIFYSDSAIYCLIGKSFKNTQVLPPVVYLEPWKTLTSFSIFVKSTILEFLNTSKWFMELYLTLEHLKCCLNTSKIDTETILTFWRFHLGFLLKSYLINYLGFFFSNLHNTSNNKTWK